MNAPRAGLGGIGRGGDAHLGAEHVCGSKPGIDARGAIQAR